MKLKYTGLIVTLIITLQIKAQSISGVILEDKNKNPLPYATFILKDQNTNKIIDGTITDENGYYTIEISEGNYDVEVKFMGFLDYKDQIIIENKIPVTLNINLKEDDQMLEEVNIIAKKSTVENFIDKRVINVGQDLLSSGGSAATVLSQISGINADENGSISLRGNQNVTILINGKPNSLSNSEILQQIQANEINKIEIITSPSSKYRADGLSGIINIITKRKTRTGLTINTNIGINSLGTRNLGSDFSYGKKQFNYRLGGSDQKIFFGNVNSQQRIGTRPFSRHTDFSFTGRNKNIKAGIDWFVNEKNDISVDLVHRLSTHQMDGDNKYNDDGVTFNQIDYVDHRHATSEINTNYRSTFKSEEHVLEVDFQFSNNKNVHNATLVPRRNIQDNKFMSTINISTLSVDYSMPLNDKINFEVGYHFNQLKMDNNFINFSNTQEVLNENKLISIQNTNAVYGLTKFEINPISFQIGLRSENYKLNSLLHDNTQIKNNFDNFFPSFHVYYDINDAFKVKFAYNKRIKRPTLWQLNPSRLQNSEYSTWRGNPNLLPEMSNGFELSPSYKSNSLSISPTIYYKLQTNSIGNSYFIEENQTIFSYQNLENSIAYGSDVNINYKNNNWLNTNLDFNVYYEKFTDEDNSDANIITKDYGFTFRNQITINKKLEFDFNWRHRGNKKGFNYYYEKTNQLNLGVRYKLSKSTNLNLRINDIFNSFTWKGTNFGEGFKNHFRYRPSSRFINITLNYLFNDGNIRKRDKKNRQYEDGGGLE